MEEKMPKSKGDLCEARYLQPSQVRRKSVRELAMQLEIKVVSQTVGEKEFEFITTSCHKLQ